MVDTSQQLASAESKLRMLQHEADEREQVCMITLIDMSDSLLIATSH